LDGFGLVTDRLGNRDDPDAMLGESAQVEFLLEGLAEKPAVAVDDNKSEGVLAVAGAFDHLLEDGPAIVDGGCARFDEFGHDLVAMTVAPGLELGTLVRD
jgi:hypothetical protein